MQTLTVREFLELGHKFWHEIHWTLWAYANLEQYQEAYRVGFKNAKGEVVPFAVWVVC